MLPLLMVCVASLAAELCKHLESVNAFLEECVAVSEAWTDTNVKWLYSK